MDETTLVNECLKGSPKAQKALFERFAPKMMGVCMRYLKEEEKAQDALQDGFVKIFSKLSDYKNEGVFEAWIRRVMVNTCLDQLRRDAKFKTDVSMDDVAYKMEYQDFIVERMMAEDLMKMVQKMPTGYRVVFNMFAIEGFSHQEIADHLGITESTSKSQYLRARAYLRERIEKKEVK
jgi:RNA polymerase sigma factor (sigma-70 family)